MLCRLSGGKTLLKYSWKCFTIVVVLFSLSGLLATPDVVKENEPNQRQREENQEEQQEKAPPSRIRAILSSLFQKLVREEIPLGSRNQVCMMTPGLLGGTDRIWSDAPMFIWEGTPEKIVVESYETGKELWRQNIAPRQHWVAYTGSVLQPGGVYVWTVSSSSGAKVQRTFEVMREKERDRIATELQNLAKEDNLKEASAIVVALHQAEYFAGQGLWSDALQTLYAIDNPTESVKETLQNITDYLCESKEI